MSIFSQNVRTTIIDPTFFNSPRTGGAGRCEFRLSNRADAYLPTFRLGNVGLALDDGTLINRYADGPGCFSCIDRIRLMDGGTEIDGLRNVGQWLTFKSLQKTNSQNINVFNNLEGGSLGVSLGATGELLSHGDKPVSKGTPSTLGTLDLREVFPILNSLSHLSMSLWKNLRVVIEYVPMTQHQKLVHSTVAANVAELHIPLPILIVDEIDDAVLVATLDKQLTQVQWTSIEHDLANIVEVPGVSAGDNETAVVQHTALRINGFQNKAVSRMLVVKNYENSLHNVVPDLAGQPVVRGLGGYGSRALHKEQFNLRLNGRNVLAGNGLTSPAQISMMLSDVWGDMNATPFSNTESVGLDSTYDLTVATVPIGLPPRNWKGVRECFPPVPGLDGTLPTSAGGGRLTTPPDAPQTWDVAPTSTQGTYIGNSSFIGIPIHDRVSSLQIDVVRTGTKSIAGGSSSSAGNYQSLNLNIFCEVSKQMQIGGGKYMISYE